jgi:Flp pilus assembly protein TadG
MTSRSGPRACAASRHRRRRGTATVEFAILLPFILFVFAVGADWCRIYYTAHTLNECARSGALAASGLAYQERGLTNAERDARGKAAAVANGTDLVPALGEPNVVVTSAGNYVTVTATSDFHMVCPCLGHGGAWTVTRSVRMPILP